MVKKSTQLIFIAILLATYAYGVFSAVLIPSVSKLARDTYLSLKLTVKDITGLEKESDRKFTESQYTFSDAEINGLIQIETVSDILNKRQQLIQEIWKASKIPETHSFDNVIKGYNFPEDSENHLYRRANLPEDTNIDLYELEMEHGFRFKIFHLTPKNKKNVLLVYYNSHTPSHHLRPISEFLREGYSVVYLEMPIITSYINNNTTTRIRGDRVYPVKSKRFGEIIFKNDHNSFWLLESEEFSPMKFFLHPITVILNRLIIENEYDRIAMTGISGGGWATILYAAIDKRIQLSYPVGHGLPFFLLGREPIPGEGHGDYESINPRVYRIANYLELYIMGAAEAGRRQTQILNIYDQCCSPGILGNHYKNAVEGHVKKINQGGSYKLHQDYSIIAHNYSDDTLDIIIKDISAGL